MRGQQELLEGRVSGAFSSSAPLVNRLNSVLQRRLSTSPEELLEGDLVVGLLLLLLFSHHRCCFLMGKF